MEKAAFNKNKSLFTSELKVNVGKKLVKCYIWNIVIYGAEKWTLRKLEQYMEDFKCGAGEVWLSSVGWIM